MTVKNSPKLLISSLYRFSGLNLHKWHAVFVNLPYLFNRPFDYLPLNGVGAEVGVYRGFHARDMLRRHKSISKLYCIDGYIPYGGAVSGEVSNLSKAKEDAARFLKKYGNRVEFIYQSSPEGISQLPPLDFCYLDGGHGFKDVTKDINAVWPLIKPGGYLGGHDFFMGFPGLIKAVSTFALNENLELNVRMSDWWVKKPIENKISS